MNLKHSTLQIIGTAPKRNYRSQLQGHSRDSLLKLSARKRACLRRRLLAQRVISLLRSNRVALGAKRTSTTRPPPSNRSNMTLTGRRQPQHGTAEVVVLGKIAIDRNTIDLVVANDRLNEL